MSRSRNSRKGKLSKAERGAETSRDRPCAGLPATAENKRLSRRVERRIARQVLHQLEVAL